MKIFSFEDFLIKIDEGLIKTYDVNKTTNYIENQMSHLSNIDYSIEIKDNNTFEFGIFDFDKIDSSNVENFIDYILNTLTNLMGWFPAYMRMENWAGSKREQKFNREYLLQIKPNVKYVCIRFESKYDKEENNIPKKLYHLSINEYTDDILKHGLLPKSKSKISSHDYDGRIYVCSDYNWCKNLISKMDFFYNQEKTEILFNVNNKSKKYKKDTSWVIWEIDSEKAGIKKLYKDPNYSHGYYIFNNIKPDCLKIFDKKH